MKKLLILVSIVSVIQISCKSQISLAKYYDTSDLYTAISLLNNYNDGELREDAFRLLAADYARDIGLIYHKNNDGVWNDFEILYARGLNLNGEIDSRWTNPDSIVVIMKIDIKRYKNGGFKIRRKGKRYNNSKRE